MLKQATFLILFSLPAFAKLDNSLILVIGDGMGQNQIALLQNFIEHSETAKRLKILDAFKRMEKLGASISISQTGAHERLSVDSSCSATQLAIGEYSLPEVVGLDEKGEPKKGILQKAQKKGFLTGLVSDTRITHATPASFVAQVPFRWQEAEIAEQSLKVAPDLLMSGGLNWFLPQSTTEWKHVPISSKRKDNKDLMALAEKKLNYKFYADKKAFQNLDTSKKVLGLFTPGNIPGAHYYYNNPKTDIPNLDDMTALSLNYFEKREKPFFLMIEGGQIDWAGHRNDQGTLLKEMLRFNSMLNKLLDWQEKHPEVSIVLTSDHETGAFSIGYSTHHLPEPVSLGQTHFSKNTPYRSLFSYAKYSILDELYKQKVSLGDIWTEYKKIRESKTDTKSLKKLIAKNTGYELSDNDLRAIIKTIPNPQQLHWHKDLKKRNMPEVAEDIRQYYYSKGNTRVALIGRRIAKYQNIIWGTGGHSFSPVLVFTLGPIKKQNLPKMTKHPELGKMMQRFLKLY